MKGSIQYTIDLFSPLVSTFQNCCIMRFLNTIAAATIGLLALAATANSALAGGADSSTPTAISTPTTPITSTSISPAQFNQSGVQVNYSGSSTLSPPSCNGGCVFAVTRASPANTGSGANIEAMVGITMSLGSNDGGASELNRLNGEMHKYTTENQVKLALSEKLAEALENGKTERAAIIAMNLAPMLGYKDYQLLLKAVASSKPINPQMRYR
jgi:hypothetical protein